MEDSSIEDTIEEDTMEEDSESNDSEEDTTEPDAEEEPVVIFSDPIPVSEPYGYGEGWLYSLTVNTQGQVGSLVRLRGCSLRTNSPSSEAAFPKVMQA